MEFETLILDISGGIATITLNRPDARNALSDDLRRDLDGALAAVKAGIGKDISAVILAGAGRAFCAGGDINTLKELSGGPAAEMRRRLRDSQARVNQIINLEVPTIALVDGAAAGAGFSLALACDFVLATPRARFVMSFGRIGLVPDWGALYLLPRIVGLQRAKELVFSARIVEPQEAQEMGIVYDIVVEDGAMDAARAFAARFADASTLAIGLAKNMLNRSFESDLHSLLDMEAAAQAIANASDYHRDAAARFLDKQPALFDWEKTQS